MLSDFRKFLLETNALALAVGVIIGAGIGKVVSSLVSDVLMPIISLGIPGGAWREAKIVLSTNPDGSVRNAIAAGQFLGNIIDFVIVALAVFMMARALIKPAPVKPADLTKLCPECQQEVPLKARRCMFCTSPV